ncbi:unnamed protein product [Closterium sp. Yama58-4]|nr:unnamed protein product [Closterium sp. Yama58-4]
MSPTRRTLASNKQAAAADEPRAPPQGLSYQDQLEFSRFFPALVGGGISSAAIAAGEAVNFPAMASAAALRAHRPMTNPSYLCDSGTDVASLNSETLAFLLANPAAALATLSHTSPATRNLSHTVHFGGATPSTGASQEAVRHASLAAAQSFPHSDAWLSQRTAINGRASGAISGVRMASSTSDSIAAAASALNHNSWRAVDGVDQRAVDWASCDVPALSHLLLLEQMRQMRQMEQTEQLSKAAADSARRGEITGGSSERADYSGGVVGGIAGGGNTERSWEMSGGGAGPAAGASNDPTAADAAFLSQLRSAHDSLPRPSFQSPTASHVKTPASGGDACWEASGTPGRGFREPQRLRAPGGGSCGLQLAVAEQLDQLQREERRDEFARGEARDNDLGTRGGARGKQRAPGRYDQRFEKAVGTEDTCPPHARPSPLLSLAPDFRDSSAGGREGGETVDGRSTDSLAADLGLASQQLVDGVAISNSGDASGSKGQQNLWSPSNTQSRSGNDWGFGGREERSRSGGAMAPPTRPASAAITSANARVAGGAAAGGAAAVAGASPGGDDVSRAGDSAHLDPHGAAPAGQLPRGSRSKSVGQMQAARILQALEHGARERVKRRRTQQKHLAHLQLQQQQEQQQQEQQQQQQEQQAQGEQQQGGLSGFATLTSPLSVSSTPLRGPTAASLHTPAHAAPHAAHFPSVPMAWGHVLPAPDAEARGGAQGRSEGETERWRREQERMAFDWSEKGPRSHSEAEKRRRERINQQLNVLRALLPGASMGKADKASVLAEAVAQLRALKAGFGKSCGEGGEGEDEREEGQLRPGEQEGVEVEAGEGQGAKEGGEKQGAERSVKAEGAGGVAATVGAAATVGVAAGMVGSSLLACDRVPEAIPREDDAVEVDLVWAHVAEQEERGDEVGEEVGEEQEEEQGEMGRGSREGLTGRKRRRGSEGVRAVCVCIWCEDRDGLLPAIEAALKPFPLRISSLESASCASRVAHVLLLHACPPLTAGTADIDPGASLPSTPVAPDYKPALAARPLGAASAAAFGAPGPSAVAAAEQEQQHEGVGRPGAEVYECREDASQAIIASGEGGMAQYVREVRAVVVDVMARWRRGELVSGGVWEDVGY